jgi:hypothetical protein
MKSHLTSILLKSALCTAALTLSGCDPIEGTIQVQKPFKLKVANSNCNPMDTSCSKEKVVTLESGAIQGRVDFRTKREMALSFKLKKATQTATFMIPKDKEIPTETGKFILLGSESKQPVDLVAELVTTYSNSPEYHETEGCRITENRRRCWVVPGGEQCDWETITVPGYRQVSYYYRHQQTNMVSSLKNAGTDDLVANFSGDHRESSKIYTYQGYCYRY